MKKTKKQKIVWALDPFEERGAIRPHLIAALKEFSHPGTTIEPVYVLCAGEYEMKPSQSRAWLMKIQPMTKKILKDAVQNVELQGLQEPKLLLENNASQSQAVKSLVAYAKRSGADLIAVGTHSKKGLSRLLLGSFAETLLLKSTIPTLVVGPHSDVFKINRILFATDIGKTSQVLFNRVIALAKAQGAKVTLFYAIPHPAEVVFESGIYLMGGGAVPLPDFVTDETERKRRIADKYAAAAKKQGVDVEVHFESNYGNISQAILKQVQSEKASLIAMAAESGPVAAILVGSITRQVVRAAHCPVWVMKTQK